MSIWAAAPKANIELHDVQFVAGDSLEDVDDCFAVGAVGEYFVDFVADARTQPFVPDWFGYRVIG